MTNRCCLIAVLMLSAGGAAFAQTGPKVLVWNQRSPQAEACFGIVGEIKSPGVYSSTAAQVTLQELIERAGGLSRRGSPSVRIIHGGRGGQSVFYRADVRDVLMPGTLVIVDALRDPQQSSMPVNDRSDRSVWVAFIGLTDRPEVVPVNPEQAQLPNIMLMLGQSTELANAVRTILPSRMPQSLSLADPLPNGAVLVFDRSLLVMNTLPIFPAAVSLTASLPPTATATAPVPPATMATPVSDLQIASLPRTQVDAQPVPFTVQATDQVPVNPASLPAPGSRFAPPPITLPPALPATTELPAMTAGPPLIVETGPETKAEIVGVPADTAQAPTSKLNPWQLLGILGSVASLVGVALVSRRYLDRSVDDAALPPAIAERLNRAPPLPPRRATEAAIAPVIETANDLGDDELRELLGGRLAIESEPIELPSRLELRSAKMQRSEPIFRLDEPELSTPHIPIKASFNEHTTFFTDAAADAAPVPAPHFRHRKPRVDAVAANPAIPTPLSTGTPFEQALSQLQEGLKS